MCEKHLRAEHGEIHKMCGSIEADNLESVKGLIDKGYIAPVLIKNRHRVLEEYLGYDSPIKNFDKVIDIIKNQLDWKQIFMPINLEKSREDLKKKSEEYDWCNCGELIEGEN